MIIPISIKRGASWQELLKNISQFLPESPFLFDTEILTNNI